MSDEHEHDIYNHPARVEALHAADKCKLLGSRALVLMALWSSTGQGLLPGELVEVTGIYNSRLTHVTKRLELANLVVKHRPMRDQRQVRWYLSGYGREQAEMLWQTLAAIQAENPTNEA